MLAACGRRLSGGAAVGQHGSQQGRGGAGSMSGHSSVAEQGVRALPVVSGVSPYAMRVIRLESLVNWEPPYRIEP